MRTVHEDITRKRKRELGGTLLDRLDLKGPLASRREFTVGLVAFGIVVLFGLVGPLVYQVDPYSIDTSLRLQAPSFAHPLGTDDYGRDLLARSMYGARTSLAVGLCTAFSVTVLGLVIGLYASMYKALDYVLMRICDGLMAIPAILLAIALMAVLGASMWNCVIALTVVYTPSMARIARSRALVIKGMPYIEALRAQGASTSRIVWLHIAPNALAPLLVQATIVFGEAILAEAALSFLGIGISAPTASWGDTLQAGKGYITRAWWMVADPGTLIVVSVLSLIFVGDGLRDMLDPRSAEGGKRS